MYQAIGGTILRSSRSRSIICIVALLSSGFCFARSATDAELRSEYCIALIEPQVTFLEENPPLQPPHQALIDEQLAKKRSDLKRLKAYLDPRRKNIDATGLTLAAQQVKSDIKESNQVYQGRLQQCLAKITTPRGRCCTNPV